MDELHLAQRIATIAIWVLPALFAITVHEVAHGWVARALGDPTAMMLGRLTVNPLKHIDPVGTVLLPGLLLYLGGFVFGWARPVPVTRENLRDPHRDMALVAVAGPGANLVMALFWTLVVRLGALTHEALPWLGVPLVYMGVAGIFINLVLLCSTWCRSCPSTVGGSSPRSCPGGSRPGSHGRSPTVSSSCWRCWPSVSLDRSCRPYYSSAPPPWGGSADFRKGSPCRSWRPWACCEPGASHSRKTTGPLGTASARPSAVAA